MQSPDARVLRGAAIPAVVAGALAAALGAVLAGADGALGVALGAALAAAFFGLGLLALVRIGRRWPELLLGGGLLVYTTQVGVLLVLLLVLRDASFLNGRAFAAGVLVATVAWLTGQTRASMTLKVPYVEPESAAARPAESPGGRP